MSFLFNHLLMTSNTVGFCQAGSWMTLLSGHLVGKKKKKTCRKHDETKEFMGIIWVYMGLYGFIWDDHGFIFNGLTTFMGKSTHRKPSIFP